MNDDDRQVRRVPKLAMEFNNMESWVMVWWSPSLAGRGSGGEGRREAGVSP
jgi:hypothetical protein